MRQVIGNLLVNAIEALDLISRKDKLIQIRSQITHGQLEFSISDNGPGLNEALAGGVFSLFQTSKSHGTGLGLWLSLHIVEKHHGCISHSNIPGGGVEFKVSIPLQPNEDILSAGVGESNLRPAE
jgi:C4-dicarboxylate-specific signal transduction histidine kinase